MILLYITIALFLAYSILIFYYRAGWQEVPVFIPAAADTDTRISVIVAARNEEKNIGNLLDSLLAQSYPTEFFEVIVVDDHSTDNTAEVVKNHPFVRLIRLKYDNINSYKKKAIETGIGAATGELIITTDADCIPPPNWLKMMAAFYKEKNAVFIAAPVKLIPGNSFLPLFQSLDFLALQGITAASVQRRIHTMCNGANLAYQRNAFYKVNGFMGIDNIASGDDMLLMQKIARRFPERVFYLLSKDVLVSTRTADTWKEFFNQRIRWASKATHYKDIKIFSVLFLVYSFNLTLLMLAIAGIWIHSLWLGLAALILAKTIIEFIFIYPVARFFNETRLLKFFFPFQPFHILYTIIAGGLGLFGSFEWKGRRVK